MSDSARANSRRSRRWVLVVTGLAAAGAGAAWRVGAGRAMSRRPRVLIVAAMAVLPFVGWLWITQPVVDPRLIGRWEYHSADGAENALLVLDSGGSRGRWSHHNPTCDHWMGDFHWNTDGKFVYFFTPGPGRNLPDVVSQSLQKLLGLTLSGRNYGRVRLSSMSPNTVSVETQYTKSPLLLRRSEDRPVAANGPAGLQAAPR